METKKEAQCLTCGYKWDTGSEKIYVNCPSCRSAVKINVIQSKEPLGDIQ